AVRPHARPDDGALLRIPAPGEQPERGRREHRDPHDACLPGHRRSARDVAVRRYQHAVRGLHPPVVLDPRVHLAPVRHRPDGLAHGARLAARGRGAALRWTMEIEHVKGKIMERMPGFPRQYGPVRSDHQPGIPFFPQETARDFVTIFLLVAMLFFLSAVVTPFLGPARSPQISELIVPDWYLLFSWGLLKVADIFPQFTIGAGTPLKTQFSAAFWGDLLSGIPVIFLLILPFIDRGREARPAKAPVRSVRGWAHRGRGDPSGGHLAHPWLARTAGASVRRRAWGVLPRVARADARLQRRRLRDDRIERPEVDRPVRRRVAPRLRGADRWPVVLKHGESSRIRLGPVRPRAEHEHAPPVPDLRGRDRVPGRAPAVQHVRVPAERVLPVRQVSHRVPGDEGRRRRARRPQPGVQHVQEATRRRAAVDVPRVRRVQRRLPVGHPVQRLHPRGTVEGPRADGRGRGYPRMMETEYGPGRTIPHPVMFRVLDTEANAL